MMTAVELPMMIATARVKLTRKRPQSDVQTPLQLAISLVGMMLQTGTGCGPQEPNWKLEAACHLAGHKGYAARIDLDDSSDDDSEDELLGCRRDNLDDDFEVGSIASIDSDIE